MIVVYTALFGDQDLLWSLPPTFYEQDVRYICFTEKERDQVGLWTYDFAMEAYVIIPGTERTLPAGPRWELRIVKTNLDNRVAARQCKILAHKHFPTARYSIWVDANVRMLVKPLDAIARWLRTRELAVFKHPHRRSYAEEAQTCARLGKESREALKAQVQFYRADGMPGAWGLASTRCVIRKHTSRIRKLENLWWREVLSRTARDQISLPYACWKLGIHWQVIPGHATMPYLPDYSPQFWFVYHGRTASQERRRRR